ncbi:MAG: DUF5724 domain-containing protein [Chloroflexota bacterium]
MFAATNESPLTPYKIKEWRHALVQRLKTADTVLYSLVQGLCGFAAESNCRPRDWYKQQEIVNAAIRSVAQLSGYLRQQLFQLVFPKFVPVIETAWHMQAALPYQRGYQKCAFRAPQALPLHQYRAAAWFSDLLNVLGGYDLTLLQIARLGRHFFYYGRADAVGRLLAAAIDIGDEEITAVLLNAARQPEGNPHFGRHVIHGLLLAADPDGWEAIERLLLAAQREEGLRQAILDAVDLAHPEAFRRMVRLLCDHNLIRFNSVTRAVDVWFGFGFTVEQNKTVEGILQELNRFLHDEPLCESALAHGSAQSVAVALAALAFCDVEKAIPHATARLQHENAAQRFVAARFLGQLQLPAAQLALEPFLADPDLVVAATAVSGQMNSSSLTLFETLEAQLPRFPKKEIVSPAPIDWPWLKVRASQKWIGSAMMDCLQERPLTRLLSHYASLDVHTRHELATHLKKRAGQEDGVEEVWLKLLGDRSSWVQEKAAKAAKLFVLTDDNAQTLEGYLKRKATDLRQELLKILATQEDTAVFTTISRLLGSRHPQQRRAGFELLQMMHQEERSLETVQTLAQQQTAKTTTEERMLTAVRAKETQTWTLKDGLGLFDPADLTKAPAIQPHPTLFEQPLLEGRSKTAVLLHSLADLIEQHAETAVTIPFRNGNQDERLLSNAHSLGSPSEALAREENLARFSLREVWEKWWQERPLSLQQEGDFLLLRGLAVLSRHYYYVYPNRHRNTPQGTKPQASWVIGVCQTLYSQVDPTEFVQHSLMNNILDWLLWLYPPEVKTDRLLDAVEHSIYLAKTADGGKLHDWRTVDKWQGWLYVARRHRQYQPEQWQPAHHNRFWQLLCTIDQCDSSVPFRIRPDLDTFKFAYQNGGANQADFLDRLIGERRQTNRSYYYFGGSFSELRQFSLRTPKPDTFEALPNLQRLVAKVRQRIVDIEVQRGELPTTASKPALALRYSGGLDNLLAMLQALGSDKIKRGWRHGQNREVVLGHLIQNSSPDADAVTFVREVGQLSLSEEVLLITAVYAPQWAHYIEAALGWPCFAEAVWWLHAHTKDSNWRVEKEVREKWTAEISRRTPLTGQELVDGAVDVAWFLRVYDGLGEERWQKLYKVAKYCGGGNGHRRAQLFADAMLGQVTQESVLKRLQSKRHQDSARALGLLPLPTDEAEREADLLARYLALQAFLAGSKKFGAQRQASEKLAVQIGIRNLARTADFADPVRLEWAMERHAVADLADGPVVAQVGPTTVALSIDFLGQPRMMVEKNGRRLKTVPKTVKKDPEVATLLTRKKEIMAQAKRMRLSLEEAMVRGDLFSAVDLWSLLTHPVLKPLLESLVFVGDDAIGYPLVGGKMLEGINGRCSPLMPDTMLRIAHPHDLLATGEWQAWQRECFRHERIQPFKQVFRELYIVTLAEKEAGTHSTRYAGQQVNSRHAMGILNKCGWIWQHEEGVHRTFHEANLTAWLNGAVSYMTPGEVGPAPLDTVCFTTRDSYEPLALESIPPRLFSEVMRDLDLVVSVAHVSGVDPEATASTVEMRGALVRETAVLLKQTNVRVQSKHVLIDGKLGRYSIHLGSGIVHQRPGNYVCIVPVHAQQRGRVFLPFADSDPKTAEILAKVIMLARDDKIKDPTIVEQLVPRG